MGMMQLWYNDMVRFMQDASEYGTFYQALTALLVPRLSAAMQICDAGCGLGYLSLALAPYVQHIAAVEKNPAAIHVLEACCEKRGITNITPCCAAMQEAAPRQKYDAMVFCFFGKIPEILEIAKQQCAGTVFVITRTYTTHRFSVGRHPTGSYGYRGIRAALQQLEIPYQEKLCDLEFGQPFRNWADVRKFFELYSRDADKTVVTEEFLRSTVVETGREDFPFYMPHLRNLAILEFSVRDIPDLTEERSIFYGSNFC